MKRSREKKKEAGNVDQGSGSMVVSIEKLMM